MINREVPIEDRELTRTQTLQGRGSNRPNRARASATSSSVSEKYKAQPCTYKSPASSVVDRVLLTANETDQFLVKVMVRQCRRPEVGDKFASRHGQKGVCGAIVPQVSADTTLQYGDSVQSEKNSVSRLSCSFVGRHAVFRRRGVSRCDHEPSWFSKSNDGRENYRTSCW